MQKFRRVFTFGLLLLLISLISEGIAQTATAYAASSGSSASSIAASTTYNYNHTHKDTSQGFDLCSTPTLSQMQNWWNGTPYGWIGTYLAGSENLAPGCNLSNLSESWTSGVKSQGWSLVPIWDGLNAPCINLNTNKMSYNGPTAFNQGQADARSASTAAEKVGIGPGSIIYGDLEYYPAGNSSCDLAVANFVNGWSGELHALGFQAGVYESASNLPSLCGYAGAITPPDDIWIAAWDGNSSQSDIANLPPSGCWVESQRLHQYNGGTVLSYNGTQLNVDLDSADGGTSDWATSGSSASSTSNKGSLLQDIHGKLVSFSVGGNGQLYQDYQTVPGSGPWSGLGSLGGSNLIEGAPSASLDVNGKLVVFAIGSDGQLYQDYQTVPGSGPWSGLASLGGGNLVGSPAVSLDVHGKLVVFALGSDGQLYQDYQTVPGSGPWSGLASLGGGNLVGSPAVSQDVNGKLVVFALSNYGQLYQDYQTVPGSGPWSGLASLGGGNLVGSPAVSLDVHGKLVVFALSSDGQLYQDYQTVPGNGPWSGLGSLGGASLVGSPAVSQDVNGKLVVFAIGSDGQLYQDYQTVPGSGPWSGLASLGGGNLIESPAVSLDVHGKLVVFAIGSDGQLYQDYQTVPGNGPWSGLASLGGGNLAYV